MSEQSGEQCKECPYCAEQIRVKATKCRFCGEFLAGGEGKDQPIVVEQVHQSIEGAQVNIVAEESRVGHVGDEIVAENYTSIEQIVQAQGDIHLGSDKREEQYDIARNWSQHKLSMREFDLCDRDLSRTHFKGADLRSANLSRAKLHKTDLSGADISGANLQGVDLSKAMLEGTDLKNSILRNANLRKANLARCDLRSVDFGCAVFLDTNLRGADLRGSNFEGAQYDAATRWPDNFDPLESGASLITETDFTAT